ncbi:steroidogenic acute regulatory protein, mitochondrial-like [Patagioenas fasciata]|uniref:steroidogenic acute regulatory protein, mitochondrial-like n=1 Tax=Patagioenas fasciata TaxID=372321 RepID=UPI003A9945F6
MLQATGKLCCGIAHDHLPVVVLAANELPVEMRGTAASSSLLTKAFPLGLKIPAVAAIQKDVKGLVVRGSHCLPSKIPHYIQRLMGKETATCPKPDGDVTPSQFSSMDLSYIAQGERALQRALSILQQHTGWQAETMLDAGAAVSSTAVPGLGTVFRAELVLAMPVARLQRELFERIEQMPQWIPTLGRVKVLQCIGMDTLVTREVTAASPGNLVSQRDFVSVRHHVRSDMATYLVGTATHAKLLPSQEGCIRAESRLSCIVLQPLAGDPGRTHFTWLLSMDLKASWIPASVTKRVLPQSQADFIRHLRWHLAATTCP